MNNSDSINQHPDLEKRFLEPEGWRWHHFKSNGRRIRFGSASPLNTVPDAVVVCLPGLSEFSEKYFEVAHTLLERNMAVWVLDWVGQGLSDRPLKNPHKRHSYGFEHDVDDLHNFILDYIKHSSVHPDKGRIPLAMLGHSMGGNIGLRYLEKYPETFECAAFSAPMIGIKAFKALPMPLAQGVTGLLNLFGDKNYVIGGSDWRADMRPSPGQGLFSSDPVRDRVHNDWCLSNPELQVGRITYGWLYEAVKSCAHTQKKSMLENIHTRCLLTLAGHENFVDNAAIKKAVQTLPDAKLLEFPEAGHEILMEKDEIRTVFFEAFQNLVQETIIDRPETLKPF